MTDAELVRACAEKVMGLEGPWCDCEWAPLDIGDGICRDCMNKVMPDPLRSDVASCAVLDKMAADGFAYRVERRNGFVPQCTHSAAFYKGHTGDEEVWGAIADNRRLAVVLAALKAHGVDTETHEERTVNERRG